MSQIFGAIITRVHVFITNINSKDINTILIYYNILMLLTVSKSRINDKDIGEWNLPKYSERIIRKIKMSRKNCVYEYILYFNGYLVTGYDISSTQSTSVCNKIILSN